MERGMQRRTELLLGKDNLEKIQSARVLIFGIGGVGSWCAEGLVRSGVRNITIVDSDRVCVTNCNRQLMATSRTIGEVKVDGDPLARALRKKFKKNKTFPRRKFQCVYSEEKPMQNQGVNKACGTGGCLCPKAKLLSGERGTDTAVYDAPGDQQLVEHEWCSTKAQINGSLCHITATFGMAIAGMVINHIIDKN